MRKLSYFSILAAVAVGAGYSACGGSGGGDGGSTGAEGDVCDTAAPCNSGLVCKTYLGVGADGGSIQICRATCQGASDCNATFTSDVCSGTGVCACTPSATSDPCTAVNPNAVCHPDYDYCVTAGSGSCQVGEAPATYNGKAICRPDGSLSGGGGVDGGADAGVDGGPTGCSGTDVQSNCPWPEYCGGSGPCEVAQNMTAAGTDQPGIACDFSASGGGNADTLRTPPVGANGPILMAMAQDTSQADCNSQSLGLDMTPDTNTNNAHLCNGDAVQQCGATESVVMFQGTVYDPKGGFATTAGAALDHQFFRVIEGSGSTRGEAADLTKPSSGAGYTGHLIPQAGWTAAGGSFVLLRCFGANDQTLSEGYVPAHFAQTTGNPGNTFCATWMN